MTLTAAAQWLNTAFAGYDKAILKIMHSLAGALGPVLTPLMKLITFLGEKGLLLLLLSLVLMCFARTRRIGVCVFGAVCCGALITNFILKDWIARPRRLKRSICTASGGRPSAPPPRTATPSPPAM